MTANNLQLKGVARDIYYAKRKDYCSNLRDFLNLLEVGKIKTP